MSEIAPATALNSAKTGQICDQCNQDIRTGDKAIAYATHYVADGWVIRRVWCDDCGDSIIGTDTDGMDEVVIDAGTLRNRLVGVTTIDRSRPKNELTRDDLSRVLHQR